MLSERSSRALAGIRFPLVMLVLVMHVHPEALHSGPVFTPVATALTQLGFTAVPCFFLMSGYLFFRGLEDWDWKAYGRKLRSRVRTLLVPYLIFNLLCISAPLLGVANPARNPDALPVLGWFWDSVTYNVGAENAFGFSLQLFYPENVPLWYVRDLMLMCIVAPLIGLAVRKLPVLVLPALALLFVFGIGNGWRGFSNSALLFFSLGSFFALRKLDLPEWAWRRRVPLIAGMLLLWVPVVWLASSPYVQQFQQLYYLVSAFAIMAIGYGLSAREPSKLAARLSESSFFIYALHMATFGGFSLLGGVDGALASLLRAGSSAFGAWCYMFIAPVAVAASAFLLFLLLRRLYPSVLAVLTGGRLIPRR